MNVGPLILGNPKEWGLWGIVTGGAGLLFGATVGTVVGVPLLVGLALQSANAGAPMVQLSTAGSGKKQ